MDIITINNPTIKEDIIRTETTRNKTFKSIRQCCVVTSNKIGPAS